MSIGRAARRHLGILLAITVLVRCMMFVSYPLGAAHYDDDQAAQGYFMAELAAGNLLVGNVRYGTGYPLVMAPLFALTRALGSLADRGFLLIQVVAHSAIPFLVYDMFRRRFRHKCAFIVALAVLLDPFGLQWAHVMLPGWLVALVCVAALWLAQLAWRASPGRRCVCFALAGVGLGMMCLARWNFAPAVAVFGFSVFLWRHIPLRQRALLCLLVAACSGGVIGAYIGLIHIPSTGVTDVNCVAAHNAMRSLREKGVAARASNGEHSARYAELLALPARAHGQTYHLSLWRRAGPWVGEADQQAFLRQPHGDVAEEIATDFPGLLYWHLGPCPVDSLLSGAFQEALALNWPRYLAGVVRAAGASLTHIQADAPVDYMYLERAEAIAWQGDNQLGMERALSRQFDGHLVWRPGLSLFSALFRPWNLIKLLTPLALLAALWRRDWLLTCVAAMLLAGLVSLAAATILTPRYISTLAPLYSILIGWLLATAVERVSRARARVKRESALGANSQ